MYPRQRGLNERALRFHLVGEVTFSRCVARGKAAERQGARGPKPGGRRREAEDIKASGKKLTPESQASEGEEMNEEQVDELLYQALETEIGGVQVYTNAIRCAINEDLREEWQKYLEETENHVTIVNEIFSKSRP